MLRVHMLNTNWKSIVSVCLLLSASVLTGCDSFSAPPAPAQTQSADAPAAVEPQADAGVAVDASDAQDTGEPGSDDASSSAAEESTPALALAAPSELLDSYRLAASFIITSQLPDGAQRTESTEVQGLWLRTDGPFGFDAAFTLTNVSGERRQELSVTAVGGDAAIQSDGAWSTVAREAALPYSDPDSLLSLPFITHINRGENLGRTQLAGVDVTHYRLTDPATFAAAVQDILPNEAGSVESVMLEGWVADAGYVVKYLLQAVLSDAQYVDESGNVLPAQQQVSASYSLDDLDAVRSIDWPADAQPPATVSVPGFVPNTFPLPAEATATPHLGKLEIRTSGTEADVASFYRAALTELGWTFEGELGFYTATKNGQTIKLSITPGADGEGAVVLVFGATEGE